MDRVRYLVVDTGGLAEFSVSSSLETSTQAVVLYGWTPLPAGSDEVRHALRSLLPSSSTGARHVDLTRTEGWSFQTAGSAKSDAVPTDDSGSLALVAAAVYETEGPPPPSSGVRWVSGSGSVRPASDGHTIAPVVGVEDKVRVLTRECVNKGPRELIFFCAVSQLPEFARAFAEQHDSDQSNFAMRSMQLIAVGPSGADDVLAGPTQDFERHGVDLRLIGVRYTKELAWAITPETDRRQRVVGPSRRMLAGSVAGMLTATIAGLGWPGSVQLALEDAWLLNRGPIAPAVNLILVDDTATHETACQPRLLRYALAVDRLRRLGVDAIGVDVFIDERQVDELYIPGHTCDVAAATDAAERPESCLPINASPASCVLDILEPKADVPSVIMVTAVQQEASFSRLLFHAGVPMGYSEVPIGDGGQIRCGFTHALGGRSRFFAQALAEELQPTGVVRNGGDCPDLPGENIGKIQFIGPPGTIARVPLGTLLGDWSELQEQMSTKLVSGDCMHRPCIAIIGVSGGGLAGDRHPTPYSQFPFGGACDPAGDGTWRLGGTRCDHMDGMELQANLAHTWLSDSRSSRPTMRAIAVAGGIGGLAVGAAWPSRAFLLTTAVACGGIWLGFGVSGHVVPVLPIGLALLAAAAVVRAVAGRAPPELTVDSLHQAAGPRL